METQANTPQKEKEIKTPTNQSQALQHSQSPKISRRQSQEIKIKHTLRDFLEGKFVTILMSLVTIFALVGDDIRLWTTTKQADIYFYWGLQISLVLFTCEVVACAVVIDNYKHSFFFYLDIVATASIISDVPWLINQIILLTGEPNLDLAADAVAGVMNTESIANGKIAQVFKSLRLIRLIRIIKLYKYIIQSKQRTEVNKATNQAQKKEQEVLQSEGENPEDDSTQSLFTRETNPSKLGKALSDQNTREVIIGVLLMLMVLPLLSPSEVDFSQEYGLRQIFWLGRSNCNPPKDDLKDTFMKVKSETPDTFFCDPTKAPLVTPEGWYEMLRWYVGSRDQGGSGKQWDLLWLYVPDYTQKGIMSTIEMIPKFGKQYDINDADPFWRQNDSCAGFKVNQDECQFRQEEMQLVTFTPGVCLDGTIVGCEYLVAYARININVATIEEAYLQFTTTIFTCFVLTVAFMIFSHDTEVIVIRPIKKVVEIIKILAENPLKSPLPPQIDEKKNKNNQMKTQMLELTIFKIGTLLQRGFGEQGCVVVSECLTLQNEGMVDLSRSGKITEMVFSICRIRQFTETTECLQEEIIVFVNKIVKIIHECTKRWDGKPIRNDGEKYLLTWRIPTYEEAVDFMEDEGKKKASSKKKHTLTRDVAGNLELSIQEQEDEKKRLVPDKKNKKAKEKSSTTNQQANDLPVLEKIAQFQQMTIKEMQQYRQEVADRSVIAALKTIAEVSRAPDLLAYTRHPKISYRFAKYKIKLSFALHTGRAIEGAIGSEFKVDAFYLSQDIQILYRVDQMCDVYESQVLITGDLQKMLSQSAQGITRKIETIVMNESPKTGKEIYCIDVVPSEPLTLDPEEPEPLIGEFIKHAEFASTPINQLSKTSVEHVLDYDHDISSIRRSINEELHRSFAQAIKTYEEGDWVNTQSFLIQAMNVAPTDGPSKFLFNYLEKQKLIVPDLWKGVRDIDKKLDPPVIEMIRKVDDEDQDIGTEAPEEKD